MPSAQAPSRSSSTTFLDISSWKEFFFGRPAVLFGPRSQSISAINLWVFSQLISTIFDGEIPHILYFPFVRAASENVKHMLRNYVRRSLSVFERQPLVFSALTGFLTASVGDLYCQIAIEKKPINLRRTAEMGAIRAGVISPLLHFYFPWLLFYFPGSSYAQVLKRVAADQFIGSPTNIVIVFVSTGLVRGQSFDSILQRIQEQWLPTWQRGITFWPFVHVLNFRFVSVPYQPIVSHAASVCWQVVLSHRTNMQLEPERPPEKPA